MPSDEERDYHSGSKIRAAEDAILRFNYAPIRVQNVQQMVDKKHG
jgi:hypothetical protein